MKDSKNQAIFKKLDRLLQQPNTHLLVVGDTEGISNNNNRDFTLVDIPVDNYQRGDYWESCHRDQVPTQDSTKRSSTSADANFNDPASH